MGHRIVATVRSFSAALEAMFVPRQPLGGHAHASPGKKRLYRFEQILNRLLQSSVSRCEAYLLQKTFY